METTDGQLMVPTAVAKAYEHINTEKFHKRRRLVYRVWSYMNAAIYLYGICRPEQITALYNLHESDVLPEPELHGIFRELEPVRGRFIYQMVGLQIRLWLRAAPIGMYCVIRRAFGLLCRTGK